MQVTVQSGKARGAVSAPPSKSMAHRLLICAAMSEGKSIIHGISQSADMAATVDCIRALGAECNLTGDTAEICGVDMRKADPKQPMYCRESGSTLRFFIPIAALSGNVSILEGAPSLMRRPLTVYESLAKEKSFDFSSDGSRVFVKGPLPAGEYRVAGNVSSQFISGLLFALPMCQGDSRICITPPVDSRSYIDLTLSALHSFGVAAEWEDDTALVVSGGQSYRPIEAVVEGDYSNAAFLEAFSRLGGQVTVTGLSKHSLQGDRVYLEYFDRLEKGSPTLDIGNCPDLGPILFSLAAAKQGATFTGTRRLRIKESDRVATMVEELQKFGTDFEIGEDSVRVIPTDFHAPAVPLCGHNDHRVVMSMAVLASVTGGTVLGAEAVAKSFPDFFDRMKDLGLEVRENA